MADAVSAGTVAVVKELRLSPPAIRTPSTLAAAE